MHSFRGTFHKTTSPYVEGGRATNLVNVVKSCGAADFVGNDQHVFARGAIILVNENEALGTQIEFCSASGCSRKVTVVDVGLKETFSGFRNIVNNHSANTFETNEGIHATVDFTNGDTFGFRSLRSKPVKE